MIIKEIFLLTITGPERFGEGASSFKSRKAGGNVASGEHKL
jgi:hypothetical protein